MKAQIKELKTQVGSPGQGTATSGEESKEEDTAAGSSGTSFVGEAEGQTVLTQESV